MSLAELAVLSALVAVVLIGSFWSEEDQYYLGPKEF